jgi:ribosome-associated heat shock protein Hsp15
MDSPLTPSAVRIDVWLWAARFFKTRALAKKACELGRVLSQGQAVKPARHVHVGERLRVNTEGGDFEIDVLQLSDVRGPAPVAQTLYRETESGRELRLKNAEERKANRAYAPAPVSRPSKRDRRRIIQFRDKRGY